VVITIAVLGRYLLKQRAQVDRLHEGRRSRKLDVEPERRQIEPSPLVAAELVVVDRAFEQLDWTEERCDATRGWAPRVGCGERWADR
jgi:hypothetical protein